MVNEDKRMKDLVVFSKTARQIWNKTTGCHFSNLDVFKNISCPKKPAANDFRKLHEMST